MEGSDKLYHWRNHRSADRSANLRKENGMMERLFSETVTVLLSYLGLISKYQVSMKRQTKNNSGSGFK